MVVADDPVVCLFAPHLNLVLLLLLRASAYRAGCGGEGGGVPATAADQGGGGLAGEQSGHVDDVSGYGMDPHSP